MSDLKNFSAIVRLILISMISIIYLWQTNIYIIDFKFEIRNLKFELDKPIIASDPHSSRDTKNTS